MLPNSRHHSWLLLNRKVDLEVGFLNSIWQQWRRKTQQKPHDDEMELELYRISWLGDLQESFLDLFVLFRLRREIVHRKAGLLHETWLDFHNFPYLAIVLAVERFCVATHMPRFLQSAVPMPLQSAEFTRKRFRARVSHRMRHCRQWSFDHGFESLSMYAMNGLCKKNCVNGNYVVRFFLWRH